MGQLSDEELQIEGYSKRYDYTQYSHDNHVNVIPEKDFKHLVQDTFGTITDTLRETYGPYGSSLLVSQLNETTTTKDGYNIYCSLGFSHQYKKMVYLAILKICERVNRTVGDGTTSCILLADKIFDRINHLIQTPDQKRQALSILSSIESELQDASNIKIDDETVRRMTEKSLKNIINLSSNYDDTLTAKLVEALNPTVDEDGYVTDVRNVIVDTSTDFTIDTDEYTIEHLPGDYRCRIEMDSDKWWVFAQPTEITVALYDHAFGNAQWDDLMESYDDNESLLILVSSVTQMFLDSTYKRYMLQCMNLKKPMRVFIAKICGSFVQHEVRDLAAIMGTEPIKLGNGPIDHSTLVKATVNVHNGNCLCVYNCKVPERYIEILKAEKASDTSKSLIRQNDFAERISALQLKNQDTILRVHSTTSLETKLVRDKIDDCVSIVNSGLKFGIVPNMFKYGSRRLHEMEENADSELKQDILCEMQNGLLDLFHMIYKSKYGVDEIPDDIYEKFTYDYKSMNIIIDEFVDLEDLPTSSQYDMEVISAAVSIVKYLLTSRALVFDANLMGVHGDLGHYEMC